MKANLDIHDKFASLFESKELRPYIKFLSQKMAEGHICISIDDPALNDFSGTQINDFKDYISEDPNDIKHFILSGNKLYFQRYFQYETELFETIQKLIEYVKKDDVLEKRREQLDAIIQDFKNFLPTDQASGDLASDEKPDWQMMAAIQGFLNSFTIITGGPGTGKTTTVAKLLALLYFSDNNIKVAMAAPTGKAAARMKEALQNNILNIQDHEKKFFNSLESKTIHRLLGYKPESIYFQHDSSNPLPYDVVIVDEASMIDMPLFAKLIRAIKPGTRLILLGDKNQLASIEAGSILGDLCKATTKPNRFSNEIVDFVNSHIDDRESKIPRSDSDSSVKASLDGHVIELVRNRRSSKVPEIGVLSRSIIQNDIEKLKQIIQQSQSGGVCIDTSYDEGNLKEFINGFEAYIIEPDIKEALKKLNKLRVLVVTREGEKGLYKINALIEKQLERKNWISTKEEYYENRPILVTQNNHDLKIYNGDVGIVRTDNFTNEKKVWFLDSQGELRSLFPTQTPKAETVFAMTIHKSQGSEYENVFILLPKKSEHALLTRELLYTGVTRAKESVFIQGTEETILSASSREIDRVSGLIERFCN